MRLPNQSLEGRVALVTGAGSGIGRATAKILSYAGASVALVGRTREELDATHAEIAAIGGQSIVGVADVANPAALDSVFAQVQTAWGRLDIVVANAGVNGLWAPLEEITPEEWDRTLDVNLRGTYLTVRAALPALKRAGGAIVVVSSVNGTRMFSNTGASAYATSKAGQLAFARMMALELAPSRIRVNTVCPGSILTHIDDNTAKRDLAQVKTPVEFPAGVVPLTEGEPGTAGQVAELIWFLVSDAASHITGTEVFIDGAQSLLQG
ncbi:MAG TPA: SDR family NAD(P)-dependent oxidoreductase [Opitutaceae bacterium]|nr:SDR family NAD(P)-dependent oxidoreductase [Opitutaceae bacterium]